MIRILLLKVFVKLPSHDMKCALLGFNRAGDKIPIKTKVYITCVVTGLSHDFNI